MIINSISVKNKFVNLENLNFDFSRCGIYLIKGENSVGKTCLINEIIYGKYDVSFNNPEESKNYKEERYNLFSYVPQFVAEDNVSLRDYIIRENESVSDSEIEKYLEKFEVDYFDLNTKLKKLSGGEKIKCGIISGILKNSPYIIMDEPTNNLDDKSIGILTEILKELSLNKTIIIVSHDVRLRLDFVKAYTLHKDRLEVEDDFMSNNNKSSRISGVLNVNSKRISKKINKLWMQVLLVAFVMVAIIFSLYIVDIEYLRKYSDDTEVDDTNGIIWIYEADMCFGDLNETYARSQGIKINKEDYYKMISLEDVPNIAKMDGVNKVLLTDIEQINNVHIDYREDEIKILSFPSIFLEAFTTQSNNNNTLIVGRVPKDDCREIIVSEYVLKTFFDYVNIKNPIGEKITIDGIEFEIVGLNMSDICFTSYMSNGKNFGLITYSEDDYSEYVKKTEKDNSKYHVSEGIYEAYLYCDVNKEEEILNSLIVDFPANNYKSTSYSSGFKYVYNRNLKINTMLWNLPSMIIYGLSFVWLNYLMFYRSERLISLYDIYYFNRKKLLKLYFNRRLILMLATIAVEILYCMLFTNYKALLIEYVLYFNGIIILPSILMYFIWLKYKKSKIKQ